MRILVEIIIDETKCQDAQGNIYNIDSIGITPRKNDGPIRYYDKKTSFYKAVCARGTKHEAEEISKGNVIIF